MKPKQLEFDEDGKLIYIHTDSSDKKSEEIMSRILCRIIWNTYAYSLGLFLKLDENSTGGGADDIFISIENKCITEFCTRYLDCFEVSPAIPVKEMKLFIEELIPLLEEGGIPAWASPDEEDTVGEP